MDPKNLIGVYMGEGCEIDVIECNADLNPIVVRLGAKYHTNVTWLYMTDAQADEMRVKLGQLLQARQEAQAEKDAADQGA